MGGGKGKAPPAPDYTAVAQSSIEAAQMAQQTSRESLDWAKEQYKEQAPRTNAYMDAMTSQTQAQTANAAKDRSRYETQYQGIEDDFNAKARSWNSPDRAAQVSGAAMGDVAQQYEAARAASTANLESFGIDPSQTRYGALDMGTRVSQAAAMAGAGTASRQNTEATGLALQGESINIGKGYPGNIAQSYSGASQAGSAGVTAGLNTSSTYGNLMGTSVQYGQVAANNRMGATGALKASGDYALQAAQINNQASSATGSTIGKLAGGALMAAALL